jgi:hypothetical protein
MLVYACPSTLFPGKPQEKVHGKQQKQHAVFL